MLCVGYKGLGQKKDGLGPTDARPTRPPIVRLARCLHCLKLKLNDNVIVNDFDNDIQIIVDSENVVELSDGIHGEAYSEKSWYAKYSKYEIIG